MEGLIPISKGAKDIMDKRFKGGNFTIGMDPALLLGDSNVIAAGLLFVPITLLIAMIMPGNKILPFGDLATIGFFIAIATGVHHGNVFRTLISGSVIMTITLWISNQMWTLQDKLGRATGVLAAGKRVSSLDQAGSPITYLLTKGFTLQMEIGFFVILIIFVSAFIYTYVSYKRGQLYKDSESVEVNK
jgi:PTS system galactitol-specific IIC component